MNKKNLSVVMAGAMLATSVAPVLAATESTVPVDQKALLEKSIKAKMESAETINSSDFDKFLDVVVEGEAKTDAANYNSLYGVKILDKDGKVVKVNGKEITFKYDQLGNALNAAKEGYTIEIHKITNASTLYGQNIVATQPKIDDSKPTIRYEKAEMATLDNLATNASAFVSSVDVVTAEEESKVTYKKLTDINDPASNKVEYVKVGDQKLDANIPLDKDGNIVKSTDVQKFDHFEKAYTWKQGKKVDVETTVEESIRVTAAAGESTHTNLTVSDVYADDVLTAKGSELSTDLKNADDKKVAADKQLVKISNVYTDGAGVNKVTVLYFLDADTAYKYRSGGTELNSAVNVNAAKADAYKSVTITSTDNDELTALKTMLETGSYKVGVIGGSNRYETAVNVAKEQGITEFTDAKQNIVLVNGESLVDGLAASPLAAVLGCTDKSGAKSAPVLMTKADSLPESTEKYINELIKGIAPSKLDEVTINLVGGKSVLTSTLEKSLRDKGFTVVRYGGDDREETSLEVAKKVGGTNAFVVGGNGEADAMSIAAVAADKTNANTSNHATPIIVSSVHGLSDEAISYIGTNVTGNATIIGGESVVSKSEEAKINDELKSSVARRIAGDNRFETNAKVISAYYTTDTTGIVAVKDGQSNKSELVDALSAANYAASMKAPVVLASNKVSDSQKTALLNVKPSTVNKVVQIGQGAEKSVLKAIADLFDVSNLK